jgi:hypothetical protein
MADQEKRAKAIEALKDIAEMTDADSPVENIEPTTALGAWTLYSQRHSEPSRKSPHRAGGMDNGRTC